MTDMMEDASPYRLLINGALVAGDEAIDVFDPALGQKLASCPCASPRQLEDAVNAANDAFPQWSRRDVSERSACILRLAERIEAEINGIAATLVAEQGKPMAEAVEEVAYAVACLRYFATLRLDEHNVAVTQEHFATVTRRPLGVAAAIIPWNFPILLAAFKLGPALIAGNCLIWKPAPTTPLASLKIGALAADIFPPGVLNILSDAGSLGEQLTAHPGIAKISFTGSTATGRMVMANAANSLKHLTLELGGNDAAIILEDADPVAIAPSLFKAAFLNAGQTCVAIKRIYAHASLHERLRRELEKLAQNVTLGAGLDAATDFGPVQNERQYRRVKRLLTDAMERGASLSATAEVPAVGWFIPPTMVWNIDDEAALVREEQFGPVVPILSYSDPLDAVRRANEGPHGLGGSVWGTDTQRAAEVAAMLDVGIVWVNEHLLLLPDFPLGGAKKSGIGSELGADALDHYTRPHVLHILAAPGQSRPDYD